MVLKFNAFDTDIQKNVQLKIRTICNLLHTYQPIVNAYVSDYYTHRLWERVPPCWWRFLTGLEPPELAFLLSPDTPCCRVAPLSLLAFRQATLSLPLARRPDCQMTVGSPDFEENVSQCMTLEHCYRRHVKPKKQHEILSLAMVIHSVCSREGATHVVDVGAGQGHLSRLLAFGYGYRVTTIEASGGHAPKASKFDSEVTKDILLGRVKKHKDRKKNKHGNPEDSATSNKQQKVSPEKDLNSVFNSTVQTTVQMSSPPDRNVQMLSQPMHVVGRVDPDVSVAEFLRTLPSTDRDFSGPSSSVIQPGCQGGNEIVLCEGEATDIDMKNEEMSTNSCAVDSHDKHFQHRQTTGRSKDSHMPQTVSDGNTCKAGDNSKQSFCDGDSSDNDLCLHSNYIESDTDDPHMHTNNDHVLHTNVESNKQILLEKPNLMKNHQKTPLVSVSNERNASEFAAAHSEHIVSTSNMEADGEGCPGDNDESEADVDHSSGISCPRLVLTGLHACGDLSATLLRVFLKCPQAAGLAAVACCYMKLTTHSSASSGGVCGYPMSRFLHSEPAAEFSWEALEMGCHFIDEYHQRLLANPLSLRCHVYRSALQEIIREKDPSFTHGTVKLTLKKTYQLPFKQYAEKALKRLNLDPTLSVVQLSRAEGHISRWREVVAFYSLRLSMAPLVETVLLLDRVLFLLENGISCELAPIFDPTVSPRNFVLIATKHKPS